jgi:hypothetical protein
MLLMLLAVVASDKSAHPKMDDDPGSLVLNRTKKE